MDVRQRVATDSLKMLVENFADPTVGCVSGELVLGRVEESAAPRGVGSYWKMEKSIRCWESASGSTLGATGALYAARRSLTKTSSRTRAAGRRSDGRCSQRGTSHL